METQKDIKSYLIEQRWISSDTITDLESKKMIICYENELYIAMRDIEGEKVWTQIRYTKPVNGLKSKTKQWDKVGYFFTVLDFTKPIIIVEGEIDFLSLAHIDNVIWVQWVANLNKLVIWLQEKGGNEIYLLIDNDDAADKSIDTLIKKTTSLDSIFDCRWYLENFKDINDYLIAWNVFNKEKMFSLAS
jgi:hypothetical protein